MLPYYKTDKHLIFQALLFVTVVFGILGNVFAESKADKARRTDGELSPQPASMDKRQGLLPDDRIVVGTVEEVKGDQIRINLGDVQPRFLSLAMAKEKNLPPIQKGDKLVVTLNDQNLVVDFHPFGEPSKQRVFRGILVTPLVVGHDRAVIRTNGGKEETFEIRPLARSRVAGLPVGEPALFLLDETNQITDAFFGSEKALARSERDYQTNQWQGSPGKGAQTRLPGTIVKGLKDGMITVRTENGKEQPYQIRPPVQEKLGNLRPGEKVILLIDDENHVIDIAAPEAIKG